MWGLSCVVLAAFASANNLLGVSHGHGLTKPLPECLADQGSRGHVVPTRSYVYLGEQLSSFFKRDIFHFDLGGDFLVEHPINNHDRFHFLGESHGCGRVFG